MGALGFFLMCLSLLYYLIKYKKWVNVQNDEVSEMESTDSKNKKYSIENENSDDIESEYLPHDKNN